MLHARTVNCLDRVGNVSVDGRAVGFSKFANFINNMENATWLISEQGESMHALLVLFQI
jgi:hypothetical protein